MTWTSLSRSKVKVTRLLCSQPCWRVRRLQRWHENVLAVENCCYVAVCSAVEGASVPMGRRGAGANRGGHQPTACFALHYLLVNPLILNIDILVQYTPLGFNFQPRFVS